MKRNFLNSSAFFLILIGAIFANILPEGKSFTVKKVEVRCDGGIQVGVKTQEASFSTNVDLKLDDFRLRCDHLDISYLEIEGKTQVKSLNATGNVICEQASRSLKAWSDELTYDRASHQLVFSSEGKTKVDQGENNLEAPVILIDLESGEAFAKGGGSIEINLEEME
jgi:lipopolysaccharide transport protein LptA